MPIDSIALPFKGIAEMTTSIQDLMDAMTAMTMRLGLHHFAIANHVEAARTPSAILLHNYPPRWAELYERKGMVYVDPVIPRSHLSDEGFAWSNMDRLAPLTRPERQIITASHEHGIGEGFTVPAHLPGEPGTCTFVNITGEPILPAIQALAHLAGLAGFTAARRLWPGREQRQKRIRPVLTRQQITIVQLIAEGNSDKKIATILGITKETATSHVKDIYFRYGVNKRSQLIYWAGRDGYLI
jgi:LuxR family quorum-sensing system transcriptional regulator CciR